MTINQRSGDPSDANRISSVDTPYCQQRAGAHAQLYPSADLGVRRSGRYPDRTRLYGKSASKNRTRYHKSQIHLYGDRRGIPVCRRIEPVKSIHEGDHRIRINFSASFWLRAMIRCSLSENTYPALVSGVISLPFFIPITLMLYSLRTPTSETD